MENNNKEQIREKLPLLKDEAKDIIWGDDPAFETVHKEAVDTSRWSIQYEIVVRRKSDGKFFRDFYSVGATEQQDEGPYDYTDPDFTQVFPKEKVTIVYE